jgi:hypothetical protein
MDHTGRGTITGLLSLRGGEFQYRVKREREPLFRIML